MRIFIQQPSKKKELKRVIHVCFFIRIWIKYLAEHIDSVRAETYWHLLEGNESKEKVMPDE